MVYLKKQKQLRYIPKGLDGNIFNIDSCNDLQQSINSINGFLVLWRYIASLGLNELYGWSDNLRNMMASIIVPEWNYFECVRLM